MNILVTGAKGFVGKNLCETLKNIRDGKDKTFCLDSSLTLFEYDVDSDPSSLKESCAAADFVFHLAGVNRPKDPREFMTGNLGFSSVLLETLEACGNACPVMLSSSTQAALKNPYGESKKAGEERFFAHGRETGARILVYRFPNLFGKWCRPNYNSAVATFCHNLAHNLPITVNDPKTHLRLAYIDDVVSELIAALSGRENRTGEFCEVGVVHEVTLGEVAELLRAFRRGRAALCVPNLKNTFERKLYAAYLSYLPEQEFSWPLTMNCDLRGSFTEIIRTPDRGQFSVNITKPGVKKGEHWHHTKNEKFVVVSGQGVIRFRRVGDDRVLEYFVSGDKMEAVDIPPGYTHNIENLGDCDLVTFMWASEPFDPEKPDTFFLEV